MSEPQGRLGRVAVVHDYLADLRGGERVFWEIATRAYPEADMYTLVYAPEHMGELGQKFLTRKVATSFVQHLPGARNHFTAYVPLFPLAAKSLNLTAYDVVISSSSAWVHGVRVDANATHVCYCYSPFRYAWLEGADLTGRGPRAAVLRALSPVLRRLDRRASRNVDMYIAISEVARERIRRFYQRESLVIGCPVDLDQFNPARRIDDYYLVVSALIPYKRVDLAISACNRLGLKLKIAGRGFDEPNLRALAGPTVEFLGRVTDAELASLYQHCEAVIFPPLEDFGLVPLEALASGRPVIAFGGGGALETMVDGLTGAFFFEQSVDSLVAALADFDARRYDPEALRAHAMKFGADAFAAALRSAVEDAVTAKGQTLDANRR